MLRKRFLIGAAVVAAIIVTPIAWYLISPLFIDVRVDEEFPVAQAAPTVAPNVPAATDVAMARAVAPATPVPTVESPEASVTLTPTAVVMAEPTPEMVVESAGDVTAAPLEPTPTVAVATAPVALKTGEFHDVEHHGSGSATIYQLPDGKRILRFENFDVLNGPDLYVWLSGATDANDEQAIIDGGYVELGRLKGNQGSQNYEIPDDVDLSAIHSVTIWCRQFGVNFATAPLG